MTRGSGTAVAFALGPSLASNAFAADYGAGHRLPGSLDLAPGAGAPTLAVVARGDKGGGWNIELRTTNFRFAPEHAGGAHVAGEGHAHLYVGGEMFTEVRGPRFHLAGPPGGKLEVMVTLNANAHQHLTVAGKALTVVVALNAD